MFIKLIQSIRFNRDLSPLESNQIELIEIKNKTELNRLIWKPSQMVGFWVYTE